MIVTVRLEPLPPKAIFAFGTSAVLEELALTVRLAADVSVSPIVKAIGPVAVSSLVERSAMSETVGAALTVTVKVRGKRLFAGWPSLTVTVMVAAPLMPGTGVKSSEPLAAGLV